MARLLDEAIPFCIHTCVIQTPFNLWLHSLTTRTVHTWLQQTALEESSISEILSFALIPQIRAIYWGS